MSQSLDGTAGFVSRCDLANNNLGYSSQTEARRRLQAKFENADSDLIENISATELGRKLSIAKDASKGRRLSEKEIADIKEEHEQSFDI